MIPASVEVFGQLFRCDKAAIDVRARATCFLESPKGAAQARDDLPSPPIGPKPPNKLRPGPAVNPRGKLMTTIFTRLVLEGRNHDTILVLCFPNRNIIMHLT